jgi:predicted ATPase/DNA-binding SARP family transcriptional activator
MLAIRILGPLEVERDGELVGIPGVKTRILLTRLALEVGTVVPTERLVDALWGEDPPAQTANALQARVSELRRVLGTSVVVSRGRGYMLAVEPQSVDSRRAAELVADARRVASAHPDLASDRYSAALALWRGGPGVGMADHSWGFSALPPLDELRLAAFEERADIELTGGRGRLLVGDLTELVADNPLRESLVELQMRALVACDRQAEALAAYRDLRARLVEQLGLEPSPRLRLLETRILAQDPTIFGTPSTDARPHDSSGRVAMNAEPLRRREMVSLPSPLSSFIDRPAEKAAAIDLLGRRRLVTITGPGGAGKTRLAIEAARSVAVPLDGIWFVSLETAESLDQIHEALLAVVGASGSDAAAALSDRLRFATLLLVLDTCEHLVEVLGEMLQRLLEEAPGLRILATSQRALNVTGEALLPLGSLPPAVAAQLFVDRARDLTPDFRLDDGDDSRQLVDEICAQIDCLPLAIELAAGRCDVLSLSEIADHLRSDFGVLRDVRSNRAARHQTLEATISWSYNLLFPDAQLLLQALSSFVGGAPIDGLLSAATSLGLPAEEVLDLLGHLVARSVVAVKRDPAGSRYRLLDSIRAFARARAIDDGRQVAIATAHAAWVVEFATAAIEGMRTDAQIAQLARVRAEWSNIDGGLTWLMLHDAARALDLASDLYYAWMILGDGRAGASRIEQALGAAGEAAGADQRALAHARGAQLLASSDSVDRALALSAHAVRDAADGSDSVQAEVNAIRGRVLIHAGRFDEGLALQAEVRRHFETAGDAWGVAMARLTIGWAHALRGEHVDAARETCAALGGLTVDDAWITHAGHRLLGVLDTEVGRYEDALAHYAIALQTARAIGSATDEGQTLARIASTQILSGDLGAAADTLEAALTVSRFAGDHATVAAVALQLAALPGVAVDG